MSAQPEALRLADELLKWSYTTTNVESAAAELRRLHKVNAELEEVNDALHEALAKCSEQLTRLGYSANHADAAIAKAEGEMK